MATVNSWTPKYHLNQRNFNELYFQANGTIAINQYSKPTTEQGKQDFGYRHLITRTNEETHGLFVCWKPDITSPGIDYLLERRLSIPSLQLFWKEDTLS